MDLTPKITLTHVYVYLTCGLHYMYLEYMTGPTADSVFLSAENKILPLCIW